MTRRPLPAEALRPGKVIHISPHKVHYRIAGTIEQDVVVEGLHYEDDDRCEVVVWWHACTCPPGMQCPPVGCTTYHHDQKVLVIEQEAAA